MSTLSRCLCGAFLGSFVALSLANCSSDKSTGAVHGLATGCLANSDCDRPLVCTFKICHAACKESRDCTSGERCLNLSEGSVCQLAEDGVTCTYSTECKAPLKCAVDSKCRVACQGDGDCLATQRCVSHVCADESEVDVRTKDLAHTNPAGGWNGATDDGGVPREDSGAGGKPGNMGGTGGNSGAGGGPGIDPDASATDAGSAPCTGTGLAKFHPSNLPVPLDVPSGLVPLGDTYCTFNTDSSDPNDATITAPHWAGCSVPPTSPARVITLKDGREATVLFAESFALSASRALTVTGQRPLIIVTTGKIDISGTITAFGSKANGWAIGGAVAPSSPARAGVCPLDTVLGGGRAGSTVAATGIGAGGGAFCGIGGPGSFDPAGAAAPLGGVSYGTPELLPLVGGSAGGTATDGVSLDLSRGGGAIELVSGTEILIGDSGIVNMGGGGGYYGSGGGSGGGILLEAPSVTVKGVLTANGGAGQGRSSIRAEGQPTDQPALGAAGGGSGSAGATAKGSAGNAGGSTLLIAGGGGGAGRIRINTGCGGDPVIAGTAVISPFESTGCFTKGSLK